MNEEVKSLKQCCKEAKKRLKNGFWTKYKQDLEQELQDAKTQGVSENKVREFFAYKVTSDISEPVNNDEQSFYEKVKKILDDEGEVSNVIGRLTDKYYYETLSYEEKQRYSLSLSEKYLKALDRYKKDKALEYKG